MPSVYNRVRYVVPEQDVEDVTQEIFIAVMNSLNSFKGKARFSTWLRTLTNRRVADYYRKRGREQEHIDPDTIESNPSLSTDIHGSTGTSSLDDKILLQTALRRLPDNYQEVLLLRFAEGLKFSEIAQERGQSLEATKSLFRRAIAALREEV